MTTYQPITHKSFGYTAHFIGSYLYVCDPKAEIKECDSVYDRTEFEKKPSHLQHKNILIYISKSNDEQFIGIDGFLHNFKDCEKIIFSTDASLPTPLLVLEDEVDDLACADLKNVEYRDEEEIAKAVIAWTRGYKSATKLYDEKIVDVIAKCLSHFNGGGVTDELKDNIKIYLKSLNQISEVLIEVKEIRIPFKSYVDENGNHSHVEYAYEYQPAIHKNKIKAKIIYR